jgi:chemotaxis protein methyltransferase CheR
MNAITPLNLSDAEFSSIKKLVLEATGICLSDSKKELVKRRFSARVRALGFNSFNAYVKFVKTDGSDEIANFCNAITTNLTSFFRENHHFEFLRDEALPRILARNENSRRLRIWSSGCSTGQEPYCLAIVLREAARALDRWDVRILATDLDENCLRTARQGEYPKKEFEKTPAKLTNKYFHSVSHDTTNHMSKPMLKAKAEIRDLITFNQLNLMLGNWPMKGKFDVIMCRNVFIYFDKPTQARLVSRYAQLQESGSILFLGHSEVIQNPQSLGYRLVGKTVYERI